MQATKFEFEHRFWIIAAIFAIGFALSAVDISAIAALQHLIAPAIKPGSPSAAMFAHGVVGFGTLLLAAAAMVRTWGSAYLRTEVVHDTNQHTESLVADGPFRFTRNPLYFANLPMAAGIGLLASRAGWFFMLAGNWLFVYRLIFREEAALRRTQGESYLAYCRAVPRFWPALTPRVPASGRRPGWGQAFVGEMFTWLFAIAELVIAITLNATAGLVVFGIGFAAHFASVPLLRWFSRSR